MKTVRKELIKKGIAVLLIILCIGTNSVVSYAKKAKDESENDNTIKLQYSVKWQGLTCYGLYSGEAYRGKPEGKGEFTGSIIIDNEEKGRIEYNGEWVDGKMDGEGTLIDYTEEKVYEGKFCENHLKGQIKEYSLDEEDAQHYLLKRYNQGVPYGACWKYDKDIIVGYDYYFNGISAKQICEEAKEYEYAELVYYANNREYRKIKLECTVKEIHYDNEDKRNTVRVEDKSGNSYMLNYDLKYKGVATNYMPFLKRGDRITVYGYYAGFSAYQRGVEYPYIEAVIAEKTDKKELNMNKPEYLYSNLLDYPYVYYNRVIRLAGTPKEVYKIDDDWVFFYFEVTGNAMKRGTYLCKVKNNKKDLKRFFSQEGELVIQGKLKLVSVVGLQDGRYEGFPVVEVKKIVKDNSATEEK